MVMPTSEQIPRSVPLATSRPECTGTVVPVAVRMTHDVVAARHPGYLEPRLF